MDRSSKGRSLGIYKPVPQEIKQAHTRERGQTFYVELCGRSIPSMNTADGVRAAIQGRVVAVESVERYWESKFGDSLETARPAMRELAKAFRPNEPIENAFRLYEKFRPSIPEGLTGWGAKGNLSLARIRSLAREK